MSTWEQIIIKVNLVSLEAQFFLVYHTKNPRSVVVGDFFYIQHNEGCYHEIFAQKRRYYLTSNGAKLIPLVIHQGSVPAHQNKCCILFYTSSKSYTFQVLSVLKSILSVLRGKRSTGYNITERLGKMPRLTSIICQDKGIKIWSVSFTYDQSYRGSSMKSNFAWLEALGIVCKHIFYSRWDFNGAFLRGWFSEEGSVKKAVSLTSGSRFLLHRKMIHFQSSVKVKMRMATE